MRIKTIKRLAIAWWLVSVAVNFGIAFEQPDRVLEVERSASVYHSYEFSEIDDTPPPKGFKPFYVSHYGRHGSRRLTGTFVADTLSSLEKAEAADGLTEAGKALLADVRRIADAHEDMSGQLTERGAQEHRTLARRMAARFPGVFVGARHVRCQSAIFHRVLISQANFTMALKDAAPAFTFDFITGDKYQKMLNGPHWARGTANVAEKIKAATDVYAKENIDPAPLVERIFSSTVLAGDALAGLIGLEGPGDRVPFADSSRDCPAWKWMPMASNLQMVFYRNAAGEVLVKVLYNEREMRIRGLEPVPWPYYRWADLRARLLGDEKKSN